VAVGFWAESTMQEDLATLLEYGKQWFNAK
jgi:hypothetical protein